MFLSGSRQQLSNKIGFAVVLFFARTRTESTAIEHQPSQGVIIMPKSRRRAFVRAQSTFASLEPKKLAKAIAAAMAMQAIGFQVAQAQQPEPAAAGQPE